MYTFSGISYPLLCSSSSFLFLFSPFQFQMLFSLVFSLFFKILTSIFQIPILSPNCLRILECFDNNYLSLILLVIIVHNILILSVINYNFLCKGLLINILLYYFSVHLIVSFYLKRQQ